MKMIKITTIAALAIVAGCARIRGSSNSDSVTTTVSASRAQALEIARTQLVHHGFTVTGAGSDVLVTTPKLVPNYLREVSTAKQPSSQRWFLVVQGSDVRFFRGAGCDNQLAAFAVADLVALEKSVKPPPPVDAEQVPQRSGRIVNAGMDNFAVA